MSLGDLTNDRQPQTRTPVPLCRGPVASPEALEDTIEVVRGDARTLVTDRDPDLLGVVACGHHDRRTRTTDPDGIAQEVRQSPAEGRRIADDLEVGQMGRRGVPFRVCGTSQSNHPNWTLLFASLARVVMPASCSA